MEYYHTSLYTVVTGCPSLPRVPLVLMAVMVKLEGLVLEGHLEIM